MSHLKTILIAMAVFATAMIQAQQIDSIQEQFTPHVTAAGPAIECGFRMYLTTSSGIDSITVKLGNSDGVADIYSATIATPVSSITYDASNNRFYIDIVTGIYSLVPPYVEAYLTLASGDQSMLSRKQLVY